MSRIFILAPAIAVLITAALAIALRWRIGPLSFWKGVVLAFVFCISVVVALSVIPRTGIRICRSTSLAQADPSLTHIKLPHGATNVDCYSSFWNDIEYASFTVSRDEYLQWCLEQQFVPAPSVDSLIQPLFVLDSRSDELIDLKDELVARLDIPYHSKDENFQAAYDEGSSRALVWYIGR